jgi:hypothetical protein
MSKNPKDIIYCQYCDTKIIRKNKARHERSKVCSAYQDATQLFNDMILTDSNKVKSFKDLIKKPYTDQNGKTIYLNRKQLKFINKMI